MEVHPSNIGGLLTQCYAVDAFLSVCKDRNAAFFAAMQSPSTISDALEKVKSAQVLSKPLGFDEVKPKVQHTSE